MPGVCKRRYALWHAYNSPYPSGFAFTLDRRCTVLRNDPAQARLKDYPFACVRHSLKYPADAGKRYPSSPDRGHAHVGHEYPSLIVLNLAQPTAVLPSHPHRVHPLLSYSPNGANS